MFSRVGKALSFLTWIPARKKRNHVNLSVRTHHHLPRCRKARWPVLWFRPRPSLTSIPAMSHVNYHWEAHLGILTCIWKTHHTKCAQSTPHSTCAPANSIDQFYHSRMHKHYLRNCRNLRSYRSKRTFLFWRDTCKTPMVSIMGMENK